MAGNESTRVAVKADESYRVLELFSGIGGMHHATQLLQSVSPVEFEIVCAVDVNTTANAIYRHNWPGVDHWQRNITGITTKQINKLRPDIIMMSPPCQPHTRQGKRRDAQDPRSDALKHILHLLPTIPSLKYILLENVQGFETSESRDMFLEVLDAQGFHYQEFLINPTQINIPNSRLRYYAVAKKKEIPWQTESPGLQEDFSGLKSCVDLLDPGIKRGDIKQYLQVGELDEYLLNEKVLGKYAKILDIVNRDSVRSCCFTKAYGQYYEGTGSVLHEAGDLDAAYGLADLAGNDAKEVFRALQVLKLRFFTPTEISRLLGFPASFSFPEETTRKQRYKTLGNSLNVTVVAILLHHLIS